MKWNKDTDILFLAVGHGTMINGKWDSGCAYSKYTEAELMLPIVKEAVKLLRKSGVRVLTDADKGNNKNMTATVAEANKRHVKLYASVHNDYSGASSGIMFYFGSAKGKKFGDTVCKFCSKAMNLRFKGGKKDLDKYEVKAPTMPSIILELGAIKADLPELKQSKKYGRALAKGILKYIGVPVYVSKRTRLRRRMGEVLAYMNVHHFKYCLQYKKCGTSWKQAKKTKRSNCATAVSYAMQLEDILEPGQIFWINGTTIHCVGKGCKARIKKYFKITHPKKTAKKAKVKSGYVCGYKANPHTQMFVKYNSKGIPLWYSFGPSDVGKKQPRHKQSYDKKPIQTVMAIKEK